MSNADLEFDTLINQVKGSSLEQKRGELEVRLGEARLQGDVDRAVEIEVELAEVIAETNPSVRLETQYPVPIAEAAFYGSAGDIIKAIEPHSEADSVALLMNLLTGFGNVVGSGSWFTVGAERHNLKLFCVFVGESSKGRKGTSWSPVYALLKDVDQEWAESRIQTGLSSGEGLIWHVRDEVYKKNDLYDEGVSDKRLLITEGEFAQTLKVLSREANTLSPVLRNAWDSGNLQTLTKSSPTKSTGAHISIIGHITKTELVRALNEIETGNGFANRFLWLCVRRSKCLPFGGDFSKIDLDKLTKKLRAAVDFAKQAGEISWAEETRPLWASIYPEISAGKLEMIGVITARAEAQVTRLACIYALLDCSVEIKPAHLKAALALWGYAEASVRYIFQDSAVDPLANKILEALAPRHSGMTRTEINNLLRGHYGANRIEAALDSLRALNIARSEKIETAGRPVERWFFIKRDAEKAENAEKGMTDGAYSA